MRVCVCVLLTTFVSSSQGFDPLATEKFVPKYKKKGRSSSGNVERRKRQVAHEDQRVSNPQYSVCVYIYILYRSEVWSHLVMSLFFKATVFINEDNIK